MEKEKTSLIGFVPVARWHPCLGHYPVHLLLPDRFAVPAVPRSRPLRAVRLFVVNKMQNTRCRGFALSWLILVAIVVVGSLFRFLWIKGKHTQQNNEKEHVYVIVL
jgi:hypothetical protein